MRLSLLVVSLVTFASACGNSEGGTSVATGGSAGAGSGGASSAGAPSSGGGGGTSSTGGAAGSAGAVNDECGGCTPPYQMCIYQVGGPGPSRYLCAEQQPCGSAEICGCIVGQGPCMFVLDSDAGTTGTCHCDNGLE